VAIETVRARLKKGRLPRAEPFLAQVTSKFSGQWE
jgi:hypothetical protein